MVLMSNSILPLTIILINMNKTNNNNANTDINEDLEDESNLTPLENEEYMDDRRNYDDEDNENSYENTITITP